MPASKNRPQHQTHQQHHHAPPNSKPKKVRKVVKIAIVFFGLLGIGISYFIAGGSLLSIASGAVIGAVAGYLFGSQMDKTLRNK
ncbi:MAG: hypothetical protein ABIN67_17145 [Ferruginibacter sp.]